jgi:hypothetical protein
MDREELSYHEAAARLGLSLSRHDDGTWSVAPFPNTEPLNAASAREPFEAFISGGRVRLPDGRVFPQRMTTEELKPVLGLDG